MRTYSSTLKQFFEFAAMCGIRPTSVTVFDIVNYISWQAERGRVHADNLQPYLSSINKFLQQTGCEPVAQGPLVNDAVSGLRALQHMQSARDSRVYIPASVMLKIFRAAQQLAKSASTIKDLELHRSMVASITAFYFFHRSDTDHALLADDLVVDASFITLRERRVKGHSSDRDRRVVRLPIAEVHEFAALVVQYKHLRRHLAPKAGSYLWSLTAAKPKNDQTAWLLQALERVGATPPPGFKWTSHSLRHGAATSAAAINVPLEKIRHCGGWAARSSAVLKYIDPTALPDSACYFFFGWLTPYARPPAPTSPDLVAGQPPPEMVDSP